MFKVIYQGIEIQCETVDEVAQIAERLGNNGDSGAPRIASVKNPQSAGLAGSRWSVHRFQTFIGQLKDGHRRFLRELVNSPDGQTDTALRQQLGLNSNKGFGPILTAISRRAKKVGMSIQDVLVSEKMTLQNGDKFLEFKASPSFVAVAKEAGGIK